MLILIIYLILANMSFFMIWDCSIDFESKRDDITFTFIGRVSLIASILQYAFVNFVKNPKSCKTHPLLVAQSVILFPFVVIYSLIEFIIVIITISIFFIKFKLLMRTIKKEINSKKGGNKT